MSNYGQYCDNTKHSNTVKAFFLIRNDDGIKVCTEIKKCMCSRRERKRDASSEKKKVKVMIRIEKF